MWNNGLYTILVSLRHFPATGNRKNCKQHLLLGQVDCNFCSTLVKSFHWFLGSWVCLGYQWVFFYFDKWRFFLLYQSVVILNHHFFRERTMNISSSRQNLQNQQQPLVDKHMNLHDKFFMEIQLLVLELNWKAWFWLVTIYDNRWPFWSTWAIFWGCFKAHVSSFQKTLSGVRF